MYQTYVNDEENDIQTETTTKISMRILFHMI